MTETPPALLVAGPTASGKSAAAAVLARLVGGEVVNADSVQVYRDLRVLSARPSPSERGEVPHHLFGHVDAAERYSVGRYLDEARAVIAEVRGRGRVPVVVGGTGLYLRALTEGLAPMPSVPPALLAEAAAAWAADSAALRDALLAVDPDAAALDPGDEQRTLRAWTVWRATGRTLTSWRAEPPAASVPGPRRSAVLCPPREALYARIEARWDAMMADGATDEVRALAARSLDPSLPAMKALGVRPLLDLVRGRITREEADRLGKRDSRRYAKRQMTWFRHQADWPWFEGAGPLMDALIGD